MKTLVIVFSLAMIVDAVATTSAHAQEQQAEYLTAVDTDQGADGNATGREERVVAGTERRADDSSENDAYAPAAWPEAPDAAGMLKRLALGTVLVLGLCCTTLWIGKRWLSRSPLNRTGNQQLRVTESISLGNRCFVALVQAGSHQILAGLDHSGLKMLVPLPQPFEAALHEVQGLENPTNGTDAGEIPGDNQPAEKTRSV